MERPISLFTPLDTQLALGQEVARVRLARNWSQRSLAARAGVSLPTVSRLERGQSVGLDVFLRVAGALDWLGRLLAAVQEAQASVSSFASLDELEKARRPRRRGRINP